MQNNSDKQLDKLIGKLIKEASLESPSQDFTTNVMSHVLDVKKESTIIYKPLISRAVWSIILLSIVALIVYILFLNTSDNSIRLGSIDFSFLSNNALSKAISEISLSRVIVYSVLSITTMICIQIAVLKNYFLNRLQT